MRTLSPAASSDTPQRFFAALTLKSGALGEVSLFAFLATTSREPADSGRQGTWVHRGELLSRVSVRRACLGGVYIMVIHIISLGRGISRGTLTDELYFSFPVRIGLCLQQKIGLARS